MSQATEQQPNAEQDMQCETSSPHPAPNASTDTPASRRTPPTPNEGNDTTCNCGAMPLTTTASERHDRGLHSADQCIGFPAEWPGAQRDGLLSADQAETGIVVNCLAVRPHLAPFDEGDRRCVLPLGHEDPLHRDEIALQWTVEEPDRVVVCPECLEPVGREHGRTCEYGAGTTVTGPQVVAFRPRGDVPPFREPVTVREALEDVHRRYCGAVAHDPVCGILHDLEGAHLQLRLDHAELRQRVTA